jgi:hypothetical protein
LLLSYQEESKGHLFFCGSCPGLDSEFLLSLPASGGRKEGGTNTSLLSTAGAVPGEVEM